MSAWKAGCFGFAGLLLAWGGYVRPAVAGSSAAEQQLVAAEQALLGASRDYRKARAGNTLSDNENRDFRDFLRQLQAKVGAACRNLRLSGGDLGPHAAFCNTGYARTEAARERTMEGPARGREQRIDDVDQNLDTAVAKFDDMLLNQQHLLDQHQRAQSSQSGGGGGGGGAGEGEGQAGGQSGGQNGSQSSGNGRSGLDAQGNPVAGVFGQGQPPSGSGSGGSVGRAGGGSRPGGKPRAAHGTVPPDIPDGQDDDVVARQLREAAMAESDPELQKRLWDEYRKYKRGSH